MVRRPTTNGNNDWGNRAGSVFRWGNQNSSGSTWVYGGDTISRPYPTPSGVDTSSSNSDPKDDTVGTPFIPGGGSGGGLAYYATVNYYDLSMRLTSIWSYMPILKDENTGMTGANAHSMQTMKTVNGMSTRLLGQEGQCFSTAQEAQKWIEEGLDWVTTSTNYSTTFRWWETPEGQLMPSPNRPGPGNTLPPYEGVYGWGNNQGGFVEKGGDSTYKTVPGGLPIGGPGPGGGAGNGGWGDLSPDNGGRRPGKFVGPSVRRGISKSFYCRGDFVLEAMETIGSNIAIIDLTVATCPLPYQYSTLECQTPIQSIDFEPDMEPIETTMDPANHDNCLTAGVLGTL